MINSLFLYIISYIIKWYVFVIKKMRNLCLLIFFLFIPCKLIDNVSLTCYSLEIVELWNRTIERERTKERTCKLVNDWRESTE